MADFSLIGGFTQADSVGKVAAASTGINVPAGGGVYGAWVELIASTSIDAAGFMARISAAAGSDNSRVAQIAIGSAGNEEVICDSLLIDNTTAGVSITSNFDIPISIPSGQRISARLNSASSGRTIEITIDTYIGSFSSTVGASRVVQNGITGFAGTAIDAGSTANTKGAWVEIAASTSEDYRSLIWAIGNNSNGTMSDGTFLFDLAIGGSGSEEIIFADLFCRTGGSESGTPPTSIPISIPSGTRLAVRSQSTITDAIDRVLSTAIYGVV